MSDDENGRPHLRLVGSPAPADGGPADDAPATPAPPAPAVPTPYPPGAWSTLHDLTGQVVMLTGYGDGLDLAIATGLADDGARLAIAHRDAERAKLVARGSSRSTSQGSVALGLDASRVEQVRRGIGAVEQLTGRLDGLVVIVELGRASAVPDGDPGVTLGEMIHIVRAAERRMAVRGHGRIVVVAGGLPRDPAVAAITAGAITEFVRTAAPGFAEHAVSINAIIADLLPSGLPESGADRPPDPAPFTPPPVDRVVDSSPFATDAAPDSPASQPVDADPAANDSSDEILDQAPVIPFRLALRAAEHPSLDPAAPVAPVETSLAGPPADVAAVVAATMLFLSPMTTAVTGQVVRVNPARSE